jgi:hypothetical protein
MVEHERQHQVADAQGHEGESIVTLGVGEPIENLPGPYRNQERNQVCPHAAAGDIGACRIEGDRDAERHETERRVLDGHERSGDRHHVAADQPGNRIVALDQPEAHAEGSVGGREQGERQAVARDAGQHIREAHRQHDPDREQPERHIEEERASRLIVDSGPIYKDLVDDPVERRVPATVDSPRRRCIDRDAQSQNDDHCRSIERRIRNADHGQRVSQHVDWFRVMPASAICGQRYREVTKTQTSEYQTETWHGPEQPELTKDDPRRSRAPRVSCQHHPRDCGAGQSQGGHGLFARASAGGVCGDDREAGERTPGSTLEA